MNNHSPNPPTAGASAPTLRRSLVGAAFLSLQPLVLQAISVPAMAYIIRRLGAEGYAQWMAAAAVLAFLTVLTNLGLRSAFVRTIAGTSHLASSALAEQLGLRLTLSVIAGSLAVGTCCLLGYSGTVVSCAAVGAAGLMLTCIATTLADMLQAVHRLRTLAVVNLISGLTLTLASVVVATLDLGPVAMAAAYLTGPAVSALSLLVIVRARLCRVHIVWNPRRFRELLVQSRFLAAHQLLFAGSAQAEGLLSPRLLGMQSYGLFAAGSMLSSRLVALPDALCAAAFPVMVQARQRGLRECAQVMRRYLAVATVGGVLVALAGVVVATPLGRLLMPEHASDFAFVVRITMWSVPFIAVELVLGYSLSAACKDALQARMAVPAAGLCLALSAFLVITFGLTGACWSMALRPGIRAAFLAVMAAKTFSRAKDTAVDETAWTILPTRKAG